MPRAPRQQFNSDPFRQPTTHEPNERFQLDLPEESISFDVASIDALLRSQGATLEHHAAILCPIGLENKNDIRHAGHNDHFGKCSNGFIYKKMGTVIANVTANSSQQNWSSHGIQDSSTAYTTLPRFYECRYDGRGLDVPIRIQHYDRIYIQDLQVQVMNTEKIEYSQTGVDFLAYPAVSVEFLIDANGREYLCGVDFDIIDGNIAWRENKAPGFNPEINRGVIYSVRYSYQPFYYVENLGHEVRLARIVNPETGAVELTRMPFQIRLQREWAFDQRRNGDGDEEPVAGARAPRRGSFSPR